MKYESTPNFSINEAATAIRTDDLTQLRLIPISISMHSSDLIEAEQICLTLSTHADPTVRGNAILGFGHLARRFGKLTHEHILSVIENALTSENNFVRSQAEATADDVEHFLKWTVQRAVS